MMDYNAPVTGTGFIYQGELEIKFFPQLILLLFIQNFK